MVKSLAVLGLATAFTFLVGCTPPVSVRPLGGAEGVRVTFSAKGEAVAVEGFEAGNWVGSLKHSTTKPGSLGAQVASLEIYRHDGSEEDLGLNTGPSEHVNAGQTNPPWNTHAHCWVYLPGYGYYLTHC